MFTAPTERDDLRRRIAALAARMVAEDGVNDYAQAKHKAAQQLGLSGKHLPDDAELEEALRLHLRLFNATEHQENLCDLRQKACKILELLTPFNVYLAGAVLDGSAGRHAEIDIQLYTDSAKDVEIFLLNRRVDFAHSTPRSDRAEAVLTLNDEVAAINLIVYPRFEERIVFKTRDGRVRQRVRLDALRNLLDETTNDSAPGIDPDTALSP